MPYGVDTVVITTVQGSKDGIDSDRASSSQKKVIYCNDMEKQKRETPLHSQVTSNLEVKGVWKGLRAQMTSKLSAKLPLGHRYWRISLFNRRHITACTQDVFSPNSLDGTVNFCVLRGCCCIRSTRLFAFAPCYSILIMVRGDTKGGRNQSGHSV